MAKSSKEQIQSDERNVLAELWKNAKQNIDTIAKNVVSQDKKHGD